MFDLITSNLELIGVTLGIVTVSLAARNNPWNWAVGVLYSFIFMVVFLQAGLYADSGLQVFYVVTGVYGFLYWMMGGKDRTPAPVKYATRTQMAILAVLGIAFTIAMGTFLDNTTDSTVPYADGFTTAFSLVAQFLLMKRLVQNWPVWIFLVNVPYIFLYINKELYLTSALQLVFIALSIIGWIEFRKLARKDEPEVVETTAEAVPA